MFKFGENTFQAFPNISVKSAKRELNVPLGAISGWVDRAFDTET